jgi:hypothetical protein
MKPSLRSRLSLAVVEKSISTFTMNCMRRTGNGEMLMNCRDAWLQPLAALGLGHLGLEAVLNSVTES